MSIKLSQKQSDAWRLLEDDTTTEILYGGAAGGGKSYLGSIWHINRRMKYKGSRGLICREELKIIKESTLITFKKVCAEMGYVSGKHYKLNAIDMVISWSNGSTTTFRELRYLPTDPDFERLGSTEYTDAWIDEAGEVVEKAFDIVNSRIRWNLQLYKLKPKILLTTNPGQNWIKAKFIKDAGGNLVVLKNYQQYVRALMDDNPDEEWRELYKEQLNKMSNPYDIARLLHGDWDARPHTGGEFYKKFDHKKSVVSTGTVRYDPALPLHITWDFNVNPYMTCIIWHITGKKAVQIDEICLESPRNTTTAVCKEFIYRYKDHKGGLFIYGDPAGRHEDTRSEKGYNDYRIIKNELVAYDPSERVLTKAPPVVMRGNFINKIFESDYQGIQIFVCQNCVQSVNDLLFLKEASDGTKLKEKERNPKTQITHEKYGHTSDAMDYLICSAFSSEFDGFQRGGAGIKITSGQNISKNRY